jgi:4-hydroxybenzoate polyprenyltransferase
VGEAWRVSLTVAGLELVLVAACGAAAATAWCLAFGFSLLMKKEFFIGSWLAPRMELYAVSHTFVAALIGMTFASGLSGLTPWRLPTKLLWMGAINWALFNVFEFARKSYAPGEEPRGETYSKRLSPAGAAALTLSQFVIAGSVLACAGGGDIHSSGRSAAYVVIFGGPLLVSMPYAFGPTPPRARFFRAAMLALALATYVILPYAGMF